MSASISAMIDKTSIKHADLMHQLSEPLQQYFGISYFCYQFVSNEGDWFTLGNHPDWLLYSAEHQFYQVDPSLIQPKHYHASSVCLPKYHQNDQFQETLVTDAIDLFDLDHPLALIEPNASGCEYYFFGAPNAHANVLQVYLTQMPQLRRDYTKYIQTEIHSIYHRCLDHSINLKEINAAGFHAKDNIMTTANECQQKIDFLKELKTILPLTMREQQCLVLYQQGLTAKQTAHRLGLSYRTIEDHFDNIKIKYGVLHKRELLDESVCPRS